MGTFAVVVMAFLAVAREGLETTLLFYAAAQGADHLGRPADRHRRRRRSPRSCSGWFIYAGAIRINLTIFFTWTGAAADPGRRRHLQVRRARPAGGGVLPGSDNLAFDMSGTLRPQHLVRRAARRDVQLHRQPHRARGDRLGRLRGAGARALPAAARRRAGRRPPAAARRVTTSRAAARSPRRDRRTTRDPRLRPGPPIAEGDLLRCVTARLLAVAGAAVLAVGLAACGKDDPPAGPASQVAVTATDTACTLASTELAAGVGQVHRHQQGTKITEFYVYARATRSWARSRTSARGTSREPARGAGRRLVPEASASRAWSATASRRRSRSPGRPRR